MVVTLFRPTSEGDRLTEHGDDADLSKMIHVDIAQTSTLSEELRQACLAYLVAFEIQPLFAQISRPMQVLDAKHRKDNVIVDRKGWL